MKCRMINHVVMVRVLLSFCWENYLILAPAFKEFRRKTPDPYREVHSICFSRRCSHA